jgi:hypothetical protein
MARSSSPQGPKRQAKKARSTVEGKVNGSFDTAFASLHAMATELGRWGGASDADSFPTTHQRSAGQLR